MSDKTREEFEEWLSNYVQQEPKNLKLFMYKLLTVKEAWQHQQKKIDELEREQERLQDEIKRRERAYWGQVEAHNQAFKAFWDMGCLKFVKERHRARQYLKNDEIQELKEERG